MKISTAAALLLPAAGLTTAYTKEDYEGGRVHDRLMALKENTFDYKRTHGLYKANKFISWFKWRVGNWKERNDKVKCRGGRAVVERGDPDQTFRCKNMDFYDFLSHEDLGSWAGEGNDAWPYVADNGREFAALGQADGTAFVEISKKGKMTYMGRLPQQSVASVWRDMKMLGDYMIIGTEAVGGELQVFDMRKLLDVDPASPRNFSTATDLTGLFTGLPVGRSHNVVVNTELGYAAAVGSQPRTDECGAGLIWINMDDPSNPSSPGCASSDGYVHDAQCLVYRGPDKKYQGRDICYSFNEDTFTIYDATDKQGVNSSSIISRTTYDGASYVHQGWVLDPNNQEFLLSNDELDEVDESGLGADGRPVTYIWDIRSLEAPINTGHYYSGDFKSIDHNLYVSNGLAFHSNYGNGLRVFDISSIPKDPSGKRVKEQAFFDIYPEDDAQGGSVEFVGTWGHALLPSGYIFVGSIERGAFLVKMNTFKWWKPSTWW